MKFETSKQLADFVGVSESCIVRWRDAGMPHSMTDGLTYTYELEEVLSWLAARSKRHRLYVEKLQEKFDEK